MKKLFNFRSSSGNKNNTNAVALPAMDKQIYWESVSDYKDETDFHPPRELVMKSQKQMQDRLNSGTTVPSLRRSCSLSSTSFFDDGVGGKIVSCASNLGKFASISFSSGPHQQSDHSSRRRCLTPERHRRRQKGSEFIQTSRPIERPHDISSENSSFCTNTSNSVLDLYIDGEQLQEKNRFKNNSQKYNIVDIKNANGRLPPRFHNTTPTSPTSSVEDNKPRAHLFRKSSRCWSLSRDWGENEFGHETPRRLAKNIVDRLSKTRAFPKSKSKEFECGVPMTIEDVYGKSLNPHRKNYSIDETDENVDVELKRRSKEAENRFILFSNELEQESFLQDCGFDMPSLIQTVRNLSEQRVSLAHEISSLVQSQISERASTKEEIKSLKVELDSRTQMLEKEKTQLQFSLEKELHRRSSDWSFKLEKYQSEENRLRDLSSFSEREEEFQHLTAKVTQLSEENQDLRMKLIQMQEKHISVEEDFSCIKTNFEKKDEECRDLHKSISRLSRTCNEQEKTLEGLREGLNEEIRKKQPSEEKFNKYVTKLRAEQVRLTGIEFAMRRELESYRVEGDSLRNENVILLNRLQGNGKETFKLDKEMWARICCLQNQGLSIMNDSGEMCSKLLKFIKGLDIVKHGSEGQFMVESEMKIQSFKRGTENLTRSLQTTCSLLHDKSNLSDCLTLGTDNDGLEKLNDRPREEITRVELKVETLLTTLLKEKLYSRELEVEQLQAELSTIIRVNDILENEVRNAQDKLSRVNHEFKELELQSIKKEENINWLESNLQEHAKDLSILRGILPKVSEERDLIWEEVKQYSEMNMLLNSEVNQLKKKIETLDEDILLKEGQITILKDSLPKRPFTFLASFDSTEEFLL